MSPAEAASATGEDLEARVLGLLDRRGVLAQAYDDLDAGVLEVLGVGVALRAEADDGDGLAVEEGEICVVVVVHSPRQSKDQASATTPSARPGMETVPSAATYGAQRSSAASRSL